MLTLTPNPEVSPLSKEEDVSDKEVLDIIFKYAYCIDKIDKDWETQYKFRTPNEDVKILEFLQNYANMKSRIKELEAENERLKTSFIHVWQCYICQVKFYDEDSYEAYSKTH